MGINDVDVFLPRNANARAVTTAGDPIRFEWFADGNEFRLEGTAVYWNDSFYGHCAEQGTVRVYPDGTVEVDGSRRTPVEGPTRGRRQDMTYSEETLIAAHTHSSDHRAEILASELCGCFYCKKTYAPTEITEWTDFQESSEEGVTVLCPKCGIDSVLGSASGYQITPEFLAAMHRYWF